MKLFYNTSVDFFSRNPARAGQRAQRFDLQQCA